MNSVERVKAICKERKIPISRLEKDLGYANGYIGQLRKGVFPGDRLQEIADYLELSIEYLMTGKESDTDNKIDYAIKLETGEIVLIERYRSLPGALKNRLQKYAEALSQLHFMEQPLLNAAHSIDGASKEDIQFDEDIMNDENF